MIKAAIIIILCLLILDAIWISMNSKMYTNVFSTIQNEPLRVKYLQAAIAYVFIIILFLNIILPKLDITSSDKSIMSCFRDSGIIGLCTYGIYNFTNFAVFERYSWKVAILDTIWGGVLFTLIAYCLKNFLYK